MLFATCIACLKKKSLGYLTDRGCNLATDAVADVAHLTDDECGDAHTHHPLHLFYPLPTLLSTIFHQ